MTSTDDTPNDAPDRTVTDQQREPWQTPSMVRYPASQVQTTGGFVNETGFS